jgi:hypothetical protein
MVHNHRAHRPTSNQQPNAPIFLNRKRTNHHHARHGHAEQERPLELPPHMLHCLKERHVFDLLGRAAPLHINAEEVCQQRLTDVHGDATKKDSKHGDPFEILPQATEERSAFVAMSHARKRLLVYDGRFFDDAIPDYGERNASGDGEDENNGDVHFEAVNVVVIEPAVEEADEEVVEDGEEPGGADGVVGANVGHDGYLGGERHVGHDEGEEETCEGAFEDPIP